jgi:AcrR family transcriptional regulator
MQAPYSNKRTQLVDAAGKLVHQRGFNRTTLADIAEEAGVPLGNVYYYFKTKASIGEAIVEQRASNCRAALRELEKLPSPENRLEVFIQGATENCATLARSGCPLGTLCVDLRKEEDGSAKAAAKNAARLLNEVTDWLEAQFRDLGHGDESPQLAQHLMAGMQGASVLAHVFGRREVMEEESVRWREWLRGLTPARCVEAKAK